MKIRLATEQDLDTVAELYTKTFNQANPDERWTTDRARSLFEHWLKKQPDMFFVAEDDGKIVGGMATNIKPWFDGNRFQDSELFVESTRQKEGVGTSLFIKSLETAIEKYHVNTFEGITFAQEGFPRTWYDKIGMTKEETLVVITGDCKKILKNLKESRG